MKYPPYKAYKESGVEWLGKIPDEWKVKRLSTCFYERREKVSDTDFTALSVGKFGVAPQIETAAKSDAGDNRKRVCISDLVINSRSDRKGASGISQFEGSVSLIYTVLQLRSGMFAGFTHYLFRSIPFQEEFYRLGKGIVADLWSTNYSEMKNIILTIPKMIEQKTVADFLDHETTKIDNLITEQQKLISLLREKRQAVISHAVTKGLDPDVPMKDSGVEWLGMVPKVWDVALIKHYMSCITDGAHVSPETENGAYDFVSTKDIDGKNILFSECLKTSKESYDYLVKTGCQPLYGDVLFSKDGTIGRAAVVNFIREFVVASSLIILRPNKQILVSEFFYYLCNSKYFIEQVNSYVKGAGLPRISIRNLQKTIGMFPPVSEQLNIVSYLDQETAKIDALTTQAEKAITLLKERRSALISAAVTGKIDVRGFAPKEAA